MSKWSLAVFNGDIENEYERFESDDDAVYRFVYGDGPRALEVYECLTPAQMVYPPDIAEGLKCPRCGGPLRKSYLPEYSYQCFECNEDFYGFEGNKEDLE